MRALQPGRRAKRGADGPGEPVTVDAPEAAPTPDAPAARPASPATPPGRVSQLLRRLYYSMPYSASSSSSTANIVEAPPRAGRAPARPEPSTSPASLHAVLDVMHQRLRSGSQPGGRGDGFKLGLVVEGGGMRGIVTGEGGGAGCILRPPPPAVDATAWRETAPRLRQHRLNHLPPRRTGAMLMELLDSGMRSCFDVVYGASAGARGRGGAGGCVSDGAWGARPAGAPGHLHQVLGARCGGRTSPPPGGPARHTGPEPQRSRLHGIGSCRCAGTPGCPSWLDHGPVLLLDKICGGLNLLDGRCP